MANEALGIKGYGILNPGASGSTVTGQCWVPLGEGSEYIRNPAVFKDRLAGGANEMLNWLQGVDMPAFTINSRFHAGGLALVTRLQRMFIPNSSSGIIDTSLGVWQWRHADDDKVEFTGCKIGRGQIAWGGGNDPVDLRLLLLPYGTETTGEDCTDVTGNSPAGRIGYMSKNVGFATTVDEAQGGVLTFDNQMIPDLSSGLSVASDGTTFPKNYFNDGPPIVTLDLIQKKGATAIIDPAASTTGQITMKFQDPTMTSGNDVFVRLRALKPTTRKGVRMGIANVMRSYMNQALDASTPSFSIAGT